jgi:hypothetical protein
VFQPENILSEKFLMGMTNSMWRQALFCRLKANSMKIYHKLIWNSGTKGIYCGLQGWVNLSSKNLNSHQPLETANIGPGKPSNERILE